MLAPVPKRKQTFLVTEGFQILFFHVAHTPLTLNIPVDDAVFMEDIDGCSDLFAVQSDDVLLQSQFGHLLQSSLVTVLHEDVHLLLEMRKRTLGP